MTAACKVSALTIRGMEAEWLKDHVHAFRRSTRKERVALEELRAAASLEFRRPNGGDGSGPAFDHLNSAQWSLPATSRVA
jgi:hypothetical protein